MNDVTSDPTAKALPLTVPGSTVRDVTYIRPSSGWRSLDFAELWHFRELLWFLALRDIKIRYKQTAIGVVWAVLQPLLTMAVFTVLYGGLLQVKSDGLPYPIFALVGLLPWQLFSYSLSQSSNSLVNEQRLISKVYFPRLIVPLASVLSGLVDFAVAFVLVILAMIPYVYSGQVVLTWAVLAVPFLVLFVLITALAIGLWLAALNVEYRDIRYIIPFLTQFWMIITPVAYPSSLVPEKYRLLYALNPMTGVVEGFRWALFGTSDPPGLLMAVSGTVVFLLLVSGLFYFRRIEGTFADLI